LLEQLESEAVPQMTELRRQLLAPLLKQIEIDLGDHVARLVTERLQFDQRAPTVKQQADTLGVTRARVYQLLEDCGKVLAVRWPEGRYPLEALAGQVDRHGTRTAAKLISEAMAIFYPGAGVSVAEREVELETA
jgi:DNA-binding transcriptional regulator YhcF (GntR family)